MPQATAHALLFVGVRLIPIGQTEAAQAEAASLGDIGGCALHADLAAMRRETQTVRLLHS